MKILRTTPKQETALQIRRSKMIFIKESKRHQEKPMKKDKYHTQQKKTKTAD